MAVTRNRPTPQGRELGEHLARFIEQEIERLGIDERCKSCALRRGTMANGCPGTVMDVLKAAVEGAEFYCHDKARNDAPCHGWVLLANAMRGDFREVPWEFTEGRMTDADAAYLEKHGKPGGPR